MNIVNDCRKLRKEYTYLTLALIGTETRVALCSSSRYSDLSFRIETEGGISSYKRKWGGTASVFLTKFCSDIFTTTHVPKFRTVKTKETRITITLVTSNEFFGQIMAHLISFRRVRKISESDC